MKHFASSSFWAAYDILPVKIKKIADKNYEFLKTNPKHPSLNFKQIDKLWTVRVGIRYRAIAIEVEDRLLGMWQTPSWRAGHRSRSYFTSHPSAHWALPTHACFGLCFFWLLGSLGGALGLLLE